MNTLTKKTLTGFNWTFSGAAAQAFIQLGVIAVLARQITPEEFGVAALALLITSFLEIVSQLGIGSALVQKEVITNVYLGTARILAVALSVISVVLLWCFATAVESFFGMDGLAILIKLLSPCFIIQAYCIGAESELQRNFKFKKLATINLISQLLGYGLVAITLAFLNYGAMSLIIAHLAKTIIRSALLVKNSPLKPMVFDKRIAIDILNFGFGFSLAKVFNFFANQGGQIVVGKILGAVALGYYSRAIFFIEMVSAFIGKTIDQVLFPAMATVQSDPLRLTRAFNRGLVFTLIAFSILGAYGVVLADEIVYVLLGSDWGEVTYTLKILFLGLVFKSAYKITDSLARAVGAVYQRAFIQAVFAIFVIVGAWLASHWGIEGVSAAIILATFINYILMIWLSSKYLSKKVLFYFAFHLPILFIFSLITLLLFFSVNYMRDNDFHPIFTLFLGGVIASLTSFFIIRFTVRIIKDEDYQWVLNAIIEKMTLVKNCRIK